MQAFELPNAICDLHERPITRQFATSSKLDRTRFGIWRGTNAMLPQEEVGAGPEFLFVDHRAVLTHASEGHDILVHRHLFAKVKRLPERGLSSLVRYTLYRFDAVAAVANADAQTASAIRRRSFSGKLG